MEPQKKTEFMGNLPHRVSTESEPRPIAVSETGTKSAETTSQSLTEKPIVAENPVFTERQQAEIKDNQTVSSGATPQAKQPQQDPAIDPAYQAIYATVDPQDQLTEAEITEEIKIGKPADAIYWLAHWWSRQIKILTSKKQS